MMCYFLVSFLTSPVLGAVKILKFLTLRKVFGINLDLAGILVD